MFTKPVNFPPIETQAKSKKKSRFNAYILCFLTLILCIILILAYRIEVKIIQQNLRKNYEDYVDTLKKDLTDEENLLILEKNNFDPKNDDYVEINIKTFDEAKDDFEAVQTSTTSGKEKITVSENKISITSGNEDKTDITSLNSEEISTENNASERISVEVEVNSDNSDFLESNSSEEDELTTIKTTESKINQTVTTSTTKGKISRSNSSTKTSITSTPNPKSKNTSITNNTNTPKAIPIEDYITQSKNKINKEPMPKKSENKTGSKQMYDPNHPGVVVIQLEDMDKPDKISSTERKYYELPKIDGTMKSRENKMNSKTTIYQGDTYDEATISNEYSIDDDSIEQNDESSITNMEKKILENFNNKRKNGEIDLDPPNESTDLFQSNVESINKVIDKIHKQVQDQIGQMSSFNLDLDIPDPFQKKTQARSTPKDIDDDEGVMIVGEVLE